LEKKQNQKPQINADNKRIGNFICIHLQFLQIIPFWYGQSQAKNRTALSQTAKQRDSHRAERLGGCTANGPTAERLYG